MQIKNSVALVTGANRGLGLAFVHALLARGARKVYAAARDRASIAAEPGVVPLALDVTDPAQIAAAVRAAGDVSLVINNAGISRNSSMLGDDALTAMRAEFETNALAPLAVARAFAPVLAKNGGGAVVNVLSAVSWITLPAAATYSASKAAAWGVTNALRGELAAQHTLVVGVHVGYVDTDMTRDLDVPKARPDDVVAATLDGIEANQPEVLADEGSRQLKQGLSHSVYLQSFGAG